MKILVVEDDPVILQSLREMAEIWGYAHDEARDGEMAWEMAQHVDYDLILLDLNLPRLDGLSLCRRLRQSLATQPLILMLTARDTNLDRVAGLDQGADDYMVKPFDPDVLRARIQALLRRAARPFQIGWHWGALVMEGEGHHASYGGEALHLTVKEGLILETLLQAGGGTCSKEKLLNAAWNLLDSPGEESLKTHVKNLRAKLSAAGAPADFVETVYGVGFRLNPNHAA
jgi:DNA-binding response OmpR family regulator